MGRKLTLEEFVVKANEKHKGKYTYSKVKYINSDTKVVITCPIHGDFEQRPYDHCAGRGCYDCSGAKKYTVEKFINKAKEVHGDRYDYSKVVYKDNKTKVILICDKHGEFEQAPSNHINARQGCPMCGMDKCANSNILSTEEFIAKARLIHGDKYAYSLVDYIRHDAPVKIICSIHGVFEQKPVYHTTGSNCPECAKEMSKLQFNPLKETLLYYVYFPQYNLYKIGITNQGLEKRFALNREKVVLLDSIQYNDGYSAWKHEQRILKKYIAYRYDGPSVLNAGNSELFVKNILPKGIKNG